jgi:hypothetical protein
MKTSYDMPVGCFQIISISPPGQLMKTTIVYKKNKFFILSFVIEIANT